MKRFLILSLVLLCIAYQYTFSQILVLDENIITFDKLSKTIIPFSASVQPSVKIEPSLEGKYALAVANGKGTLTFAAPVPAGAYTITLTASGQTAVATWKVLPTALDPKSMKSLAGMKQYYGKRLVLRTRLPREAEIPLQQFKIDYQLGNEPLVKDNPYSESWTGPNIPASARTVKAAVVWVYPLTGERVALWQRDIEPEQEAPEISCANTSLRYEFDAKANTYMLFVNGISVDYEVPIDADNSIPDASKSVKATLQNVQADVASLDYASADFGLRVYRGDEPDPTARWSANEATFKIVESKYDAVSGSFPLKIQMRDLPASGTNVRGTIAVRVQASVVNAKAGKTEQSHSAPCVLAVDIPINTDKTIAEGAPILTTKTMTLPADVFLKHQPWLSERFKKMDFDVFYADVTTIEALHHALTPRPERTPALEQAEQECTNADEIKKRIWNKRFVPQALIDGGHSIKDCELVKEYYSALASYVPVTQVAMLVSKPKVGKPLELLGALALKSQRVAGRDVVDMMAPLKAYSSDETKNISLNGSSLFDMLVKQLTVLEQSVLERKVTVETQELIPLQNTNKAVLSDKKKAKSK